MTRSPRRLPSNWTAAQDAELRRAWPAGEELGTIGKALARLGPRRTPLAIRVRAMNLGLRRPKRAAKVKAPTRPHRLSTWPAAQDAILRRLWPTHAPVAEIVAEINAVAGSIPHDEAAAYNRASKLKLRRPATALQNWRKRGAKAPEQAPGEAAWRAQARTELRGGVKVTVCPPAHAWGGWRTGRVAGRAARGMT